LKTLGSSIPVIVITSSLSPLSRNRSMQEGAFAYLTKPFGDKVLIEHVRAALGGNAGQRNPGDGRKS
jgi:DNA-binding response OmpR family regulator